MVRKEVGTAVVLRAHFNTTVVLTTATEIPFEGLLAAGQKDRLMTPGFIVLPLVSREWKNGSNSSYKQL